MPRTGRVIDVPKPAPGSFNKNRRAGALLLAQSAHLQKALVKLHGEVIRHKAEIESLLAIDLKEVTTEKEVSEYAQRITRLLHVQPEAQHRK